MDQIKYQAFLAVAKQLNHIHITPVLMGSLGMERVTQLDWYPNDIDIHVPGDPRGWEMQGEQIDQWINIKEMMEDLGYKLMDLHEHEFVKHDIHIEIGNMTTLYAFSGVKVETLKKINDKGIIYYLPDEKQFLAIYEASLRDSYRQDHNNGKDVAKIEYLKSIIK